MWRGDFLPLPSMPQIENNNLLTASQAWLLAKMDANELVSTLDSVLRPCSSLGFVLAEALIQGTLSGRAETHLANYEKQW